MLVSQFIYRNAVYLFLAILVLSILVFGGQYFLRAAAGGGGFFPLAIFHAITAGLWCVLLVAQGYLVRKQQLAHHKSLGRIAYLLAPIVAFSIIWLSLDVLRYTGLDEGALYILSVRVFLFVFFVGFLGLALYNKHQPEVHSRWMICSAVVLLDPILSRVSAVLHPVAWTSGFHQLVAFAVMNLIVFLLAVADWRQGRRDVFPAALIFMLVGQVAALTMWKTEAFRSS